MWSARQARTGVRTPPPLLERSGEVTFARWGVMITTSVLLFSTLFAPFLEARPAVEPVYRCDDGSAPKNRYGRPNWLCRIDGCGPQAELCWADRLDHCFDSAGNDLGVCVYTVIPCGSVFSCFELWFACGGTWECERPGTVGCKQGKCTIADGSDETAPECAVDDDEMTWQGEA